MPAAGRERRDVDVLVVGAGLSGLTAAYELVRSGLSVRVLEAADEVGGRTRSGLVAGEVVDFGAEWVGGRHRHVLGLVDELGLSTRFTQQLVRPILWRGPTGAERLGVPGLSGAPGLVRAYAGLQSLARRVDPDAPWRSDGAAELDRIDLRAWLAGRGVEEEGLYFFEKVIGGLTSTTLDRLSLLHLLWWIRRGGGTIRTLWTTFERVIPGGAHQISRRLAARLGDAIELGARVTRLTQGDTVRAELAGGGEAGAARAIVTAPLGVLSEIEFDPPLSERQAALDGVAIRPGTKVSAVLPGARTAHRLMVGGELLDGAWRVGERLTGFASPPRDAAPESALVSELASAFRTTPARLRDAQVFRWSDRDWVPGCDVGFAPGQICELGPELRRPHGRVHFAGTERSSWPNNMEGAVESGRWAAREVARLPA